MIPPSFQRIIDRFQRLSDPKQRYEQLILYGKKLPPFPESLKIPSNRVAGCVSQVYVTADFDQNELLTFQGDADALISKGFVGLLAAGMNGLTQSEVEALTPDFITETGLSASLTPSRANGFYNVFKTMQSQSRALERSRVQQA
ncbi:MAG: SufE family protein [Oscillatoriales cyanobacterium SM2_2_1]|nr:SufE family protein [Oscillatoriales cyanobacterium SM2_2_1]